MSDILYRKSVGMMLLNPKGQVFVGQRIDQPGPAWQMPQGGLEEGESLHAAVFRELREELGTDKAEILAEAPEWLSYDLPLDLQPLLWEGKYRGQRQRWFLLQFTGVDADINIHTADPEFSDWKWIPPHLIPGLTAPFKRPLQEKLLEIFRDFLENSSGDFSTARRGDA